MKTGKMRQIEAFSWQLTTLSDIYKYEYPGGYLLPNAENLVEKVIRDFFYVRNVSFGGLVVRILTNSPICWGETPRYKLCCDIDAVFVDSVNISGEYPLYKQVLPKVTLVGDIDEELFSQGFIFESIRGNPVVSLIKTILRCIDKEDIFIVAKELLRETLDRFENSYPDWAINLSDFLDVDPLSEVYLTDFDDTECLRSFGIDF